MESPLNSLPLCTENTLHTGSRKGCEFNNSMRNDRAFPGSSAGKESPYNAGDPGLIPGLGRPVGEGTGYPLHYSGLEKLYTVSKNKTRS